MAEVKCGDCKFFEIDQAVPERGKCRRFPPIAQMEIVAKEGEAPFMVPFTDAPLTLTAGWCGEFQAGVAQ